MNRYTGNLLTRANEYNVICFATRRFYLWINGNLCESISANKLIELTVYRVFPMEMRSKRDRHTAGFVALHACARVFPVNFDEMNLHCT